MRRTSSVSVIPTWGITSPTCKLLRVTCYFRLQHDGGMAANRPAVITRHRRRARAAVLRVFARPAHLPLVSVRRRQERLRKRRGDEIGTEIDAQQPLVPGAIGEVMQR